MTGPTATTGGSFDAGDTGGGQGVRPETEPTEGELVIRVLSALLREDVVGLRTRSTLVQRPDGAWLQRSDGQGGFLLLPVVEDGFQCEFTARLPLVVGEFEEAAHVPVPYETCDETLGVLRVLADPVDQGGFDAFAEECRQTLATIRLHASFRPEVAERLADRLGADPADWTGLTAGPAFDTLAAHLDHPVYPTARGRSGLAEEQLRAYAPEFHPHFSLRWLAVPRDAVTGTFPDHWPTPGLIGLGELDRTHVALPVHPLTVGPLEGALRATGLAGRAVLADPAHLEAVPTLSMRTVALSADPLLHVKLP